MFEKSTREIVKQLANVETSLNEIDTRICSLHEEKKTYLQELEEIKKTCDCILKKANS